MVFRVGWEWYDEDKKQMKETNMLVMARDGVKAQKMVQTHIRQENGGKLPKKFDLTMCSHEIDEFILTDVKPSNQTKET